jgi:hypothetical protein
MPSRKITNRRNKATTEATAPEAVIAAPEATTEATDTAPVATTEATTEAAPEAAPEAALPADIDPALANDSDLTHAEKLFLHSLPDTDAAPVALNIDAVPLNDIAPVITSTVPTTAPVAVPDAKAAFLDKKAAATLSAISLYPGASLAVHRSDKQPADSTYLARVASPVQKIGPNGPTARDNSFILAVYDYLSNYFAANYSVGFNPANFGADLGTTSRAASIGYLALTDDASDIVLTPSGIERGALLSRKRAEAAAKAAADAAK